MQTTISRTGSLRVLGGEDVGEHGALLHGREP